MLIYHILGNPIEGHVYTTQHGGTVHTLKDLLWTIECLDSKDEKFMLNYKRMLIELYVNLPKDHYNYSSGNRYSPIELALEIIVLKALCFYTKFQYDLTNHNTLSRLCQCARVAKSYKSKRHTKVYDHIVFELARANIAWNNVDGILGFVRDKYSNDLHIFKHYADTIIEIVKE